MAELFEVVLPYLGLEQIPMEESESRWFFVAHFAFCDRIRTD